MAEAQTETVRLLKGVELPGGAEQPKARLVEESEAGVPFWRQATQAPDATSFLGHLRSEDNHAGNAHTRRIRALLDLPAPTGFPPQPGT